MCAMWDDPPFVRDPSDGIRQGRFRVTELDTYDHDEWTIKEFGNEKEAKKYAAEMQKEKSGRIYRVWNDKKRIIYP